ncbi:MAG TPA: hypothetical protein VLC46_20410 [Thermoanaerobaculia bacterium]|nr:hypothetical protein [Thermoanaerobaculia bacterium]
MIKKLIDEHVVRPLTLAITNSMKGALQHMTDQLDSVETKVENLTTAIHDARTRSDGVIARLTALQATVDAHPATADDPRLQKISDEIDSISVDVAAIAPAPAAPPAAGTGDTSGSGTPPAAPAAEP